MSNDLEKRTEEILTTLGEELVKSRARYADALMRGEDLLPYKEEEKPKSVKKRSRKMLRRTLILVAVLILVFGMAIVSVDGVKEKLFSGILTVKEGHTDISHAPLETGEIPDFDVTYMPEGYNLLQEDELEDCYKMKTYGNEGNHYYIIKITLTEDYEASVDNDSLKQEKVRVNDHEAILFVGEEGFVMVWEIGDYTIDISGTFDKKLDKNELNRIVRSIYFK